MITTDDITRELNNRGYTAETFGQLLDTLKPNNDLANIDREIAAVDMKRKEVVYPLEQERVALLAKKQALIDELAASVVKP